MNAPQSRLSALFLGTVAIAGLAFAGRAWSAHRRQGDWKTIQPEFTSLPSTWNSAFPLSDQANAGGWKLVDAMSDEFNEDKLDTDKWQTHADPGWLGSEPGWKTGDNSSVKDGNLLIDIKKEEAPATMKNAAERHYSMGSVVSKATQKYGYFEAKLKAMKTRADSGFWLRHQDDKNRTELDIVELPGTYADSQYYPHITATVWWTPTDRTKKESPGKVKLNEDPTASYHVYGCEWGPNEIKFYVDGKLARDGKTSEFNQDMNIRFTAELVKSWLGLPPDGDLPASMSVDYVRTWQRSW